MSHGCTHFVLLPAIEHMCTVTGSKCTVHRNTFRPTHRAQTHHSNKQQPKSSGGGGVTANSSTPALSRHWDYFFFPLTPLFCMSCAAGIFVASELELVERVAGPVCASSWVLTGGLGLFIPRLFR